MKKDIDDFSYRQGLNSNNRQFRIMTLSDNGFDEYINKHSYTHFYLYDKHLQKYTKEMDARNKFKNCSIKHFGLKKDVNSLTLQSDSKRQIINKEKLLEKIEEKQNNLDTQSDNSKANKSGYKTIDEFSNLAEENICNIKNSQNIKTSLNIVDQRSLQNCNIQNIQFNNSTSFQYSKSENINHFNNSIKNTENMRYKASQTTPGFFKNTNSTQLTNKNKVKNFNPLSKSQTKPIRLLKIRKSENMTFALENLRESLTSFSNTNPGFFQKNESFIKRGFTSNNVPRVEHLRMGIKSSPSEAFKFYKSKFMISMKNDIEDENKRIKQILDDHHVPLPKILKSKEPNRKRYFSNTKFMGEKFDPSNYDYIFFNSNTKRNVYGALFQH
jgi:hypothetical protein